MPGGLTQEEYDYKVNRIRALFVRGLPTSTIIERLSCCKSSVGRWKAKLGFAKEQPKRREEKQIVHVLKLHFIDGYTYDAIAAELNTTRSAVAGVVRRAKENKRISLQSRLANVQNTELSNASCAL